MDRHQAQDLDRYITGNFGEDQFRDDREDEVDAEQTGQARHIIRFDGNPDKKLIPAVLVSGRKNPAVPTDTLLGHLGNALAGLEDAILHAEPRTDDGGRPTSWATIRLEEAVRIASRVRAVRKELERAIGRQGMIDTSAHADNLPF